MTAFFYQKKSVFVGKKGRASFQFFKKAGRHQKWAGRHQKWAGRRVLQKRPRQNTEIIYCNQTLIARGPMCGS